MITTRLYRSQLPLIIFVFVLIGLSAAFVGLHLATPFDNGRLQPGSNAITADGLIVTPLEGGPEGFLAGDVVTNVEAESIEAWLTMGSPGWSAGDIVTYAVIREGQKTAVVVTLGRYPLGQILAGEWGMMIFRLAYLLIAGYVYIRRPNALASRLLLLAAATQVSSSTWSFGAQVSDFLGGSGIWLYHVTTIFAFILSWIAAFHFALVFPQPLPFVKHRRWFIPLIYVLPFLGLALYLTWTRTEAVNILDWMSFWGPPTGFYAAVFLLLTLAAITWQYLRHKSGASRLQMRWLATAAVFVGGFAVLFYFVPPFLNLPTLDRNLIGIVGLIFPLAIAVAILRYNLFDIDTILNRALVYGGLTAVVITLYVLIVGALGTILQSQGNLFIALAATGLVAVLFQPLRERLQKAVNRFMYGERDEPFEVLARLGQRLEGTLTPEMVFPTIVETVSQALKLPYAAVSVWRNGQWETAESYGKPVQYPVTYPLTHRGEPVGRLLVAHRAPDEAFSPADERILRNIARQAGAAVHAVQLVADLQQSRQQLVTAREEEWRRLRRDLLDGLGPQLASQTLTIDAIDKLISRDPEKARGLLQDLKKQAKAAVQDIRRLVYDLRPPALDELGLVGALREGAARQSLNGLRITVEATSPLPPLPAAVEVAAYRIAQEAMTNAVRHAGATLCSVQLSLPHPGNADALCLAIQDNGRGLPTDYNTGVGLQSMRERAAELGGSCRIESLAAGGVCVTAEFPLPVDKAL
jgi:signal transduction histidine kinase